MPAASLAFSTPAAAPPWRRWLWYSPAARLVGFVLLLVAFGYAAATLTALVGWTAKSAPAGQRAVATLAMQLLPALLAYLILVRGIERRTMAELDWRDLRRYGGGGLVFGFALLSVVAAVLWLAGSYRASLSEAPVNWAFGLLVAGLGAGIGEEIITRGVLFRVLEEGLGTWWALLVSAAFFGAAHVFNPGATAASSIAIMIEAGLLLALVYHVTRSLWACIGLHAAWNVTEGLIYGMPVSGTPAQGLLSATLTGPDWLTGGAFGPEASLVTVTVCLVPSLMLLRLALQRRSIVPPAWRRAGTLAAGHHPARA